MRRREPALVALVKVAAIGAESDLQRTLQPQIRRMIGVEERRAREQVGVEVET